MRMIHEERHSQDGKAIHWCRPKTRYRVQCVDKVSEQQQKMMNKYKNLETTHQLMLIAIKTAGCCNPNWFKTRVHSSVKVSSHSMKLYGAHNNDTAVSLYQCPHDNCVIYLTCTSVWISGQYFVKLFVVDTIKHLQCPTLSTFTSARYHLIDWLSANSCMFNWTNDNNNGNDCIEFTI